MARIGQFLVPVLALLSIPELCSGVKIVMVHMFGGSHYLTTGVVANELARRGHEVTTLSPGTKKMQHALYKTIQYNPGFEPDYLVNHTKETLQSSQVGVRHQLSGFFMLMDLMLSVCNALIDNGNLVSELESADLLIMEPLVFCAPAIARKYNKPWIAILPLTLSLFTHSSFKIPINPSYVPFAESPSSDDMCFIERVVNFISYKAFGVFFTAALNWRLHPFKERMGISIYTDLLGMTGEAKILLGSCDFALDYPFPLMPNTFCVGPFLIEPAKPLPDDLSQYASGPNGFILAAFGTVFNTFTREQVQMMANVFKSLEQRVIWQLQDPYDVKIPDNVVIMKWLPQNDLLGHQNIRLFISHVGASSAYQAIYHGVPVLATPRAADQWGNGYRLQNRVGMAKVVGIKKITQAEFQEGLQDVLTDKAYLQNAKKASRRLKTKRQTPMQVAGDLIEYVIDNEYDVAHLQAHALKLPFYAHDLWDIYLFVATTFLIGLLVTYYVIRLFLRILRRKKLKSE